MILTCSFGGTRYRLESSGLAERVVEVNRRAAELARDATGGAVFVAGDMGPTGLLMAPLGPLTYAMAVAAYAEQALGLAEGGVDLLIIETMSDLSEARAAIEAARMTVSLPLLCTFSFDTHGRTMMGISPGTVAREIGPLVDVVGANCGRNPAEFPAFLQEMRRVAPDALLCAKPNAGLPRLVGDDVVFNAGPGEMAPIALELRVAGAQVIGGCCGTTPEHIAAMADALRGTTASAGPVSGNSLVPLPSEEP